MKLGGGGGMAYPDRQLGGRRSEAGFFVALVCAAGLLFLALSGYMRSLERRAMDAPAIREQLTADGKARPLAHVAAAIREMKLVTVEVDSSVVSETADQNWRGEVNAKVCAPVKLFYGADLSQLSVESMAMSPVNGGLLVRIPRPERIATEVCGEAESIEVQLGWLRLRSRAGEYYLGLARKDLHERALDLKLSPEDARLVRKTTKEQTEALIKKIVGPDRPVAVVYEDGQP